jgi:hypothetical protein
MTQLTSTKSTLIQFYLACSKYEYSRMKDIAADFEIKNKQSQRAYNLGFKLAHQRTLRERKVHL